MKGRKVQVLLAAILLLITCISHRQSEGRSHAPTEVVLYSSCCDTV